MESTERPSAVVQEVPPEKLDSWRVGSLCHRGIDGLYELGPSGRPPSRRGKHARRVGLGRAALEPTTRKIQSRDALTAALLALTRCDQEML